MRSMLIGIVLTFSLIIVFNFIFPAFLNNANYVVFGAVFIFPFIIFTCYALFRHNLLNIKVISAEILTMVLALVFLIEIIVSKDIAVIILRSSGFLLVLGVGILLGVGSWTLGVLHDLAFLLQHQRLHALPAAGGSPPHRLARVRGL